MVVEDGVQRHVVGFGFEIFYKAGAKSQAHREGSGFQRGQHTVVKTAAVTQAIATRTIAHTGCKQQRGHDDLGVLGLRNAVSIFFHGAAGVPGMEDHGLVLFIDHRQANAPRLGLVEQLSIFLPAVQGWQRIELALDGPVGANDGIGATHQPDAHDPLQKIRTL